MKLLFSILILLSLCNAQYKPLSRSEKKQFVKAADALNSAAKERNFQAIQRFAPEILKTNESILLDPDCKKLRPLYHQIEQLLQSSYGELKLDSLKQSVDSKIASGDLKGILTEYQSLLDYLQAKDDSLYKITLIQIPIYQGKYFKSNPSLNSLQFIASLKHYDKLLWSEQSKQLDSELKKEFAQVSLEMNRIKLNEFQTKYPGLYQNEIISLLSRMRLKDRASIMKKPSMEAINTYYSIYPEPDNIIEEIAEKVLYDEWQFYQSTELAKAFIKRFPKSRNIPEINQWLHDINMSSGQIDSQEYGGNVVITR